MIFSRHGREFRVLGIQVRIPGPDGLVAAERKVIDKMAVHMGYENALQMAIENGYDNPGVMAYCHSFKNPRDYFLGKGWSDRLSRYDKNGKDLPSDTQLLEIDPAYLTRRENGRSKTRW